MSASIIPFVYHLDLSTRFTIRTCLYLKKGACSELDNVTMYANEIVDPSFEGSRVGAVVRALAFHQCVPGSIPGPRVICGLSLLVLYSAPRGFSPGTPVFPSPQKPTFDLI